MWPKKLQCSKKQNKQVLADPGTCLFCLSSEDCDEKYGTMLSNGQITTHYFCMLFAYGLSQNGEDHEGLLGFQIKDIKCELSRGARLKCSYCKVAGATIGCIVPKCRAQYHFACGRENEALFQFFDRYISFCREHRPSQKSAPRDRLAFKGTTKSTCSICMCSVNARVSNNTIRVTCCNNGWFHRDCIQRHATSSGMHFFKCALCNNKDKFQEEMLECGIYIPDKDASWELEPGAFRELYERHNRCDAPHCTCPGGRTTNELNSRYELMLCDVCGSAGTHLACTPGLYTAMDDWACAECTGLKTKNKKKLTAARGGKKKRKASALSPRHNRRSAKRLRGVSSSTLATAAAASASWTPSYSLPGSSSSISSSSSPITRLRDAAPAARSASPLSSDGSSSRLSSALRRPSLCLKENKKIQQERLSVLSSSSSSSSPVQVPKLNWPKTFSDMHITGASYENASETATASSDGSQQEASDYTSPSPGLRADSPNVSHRTTIRSILARRYAANRYLDHPNIASNHHQRELHFLRDDLWTGKNLGTKHNSPLTEIGNNLHLNIADAFSLSKEQSDNKSQSSDDDVVVTPVVPSIVVRMSRKDKGDMFVDVEGE